MKLFANMFVMALFAMVAASANAEIKVETVADGLDNPCGIAIQPETGDVFVADSGAKRIVRIANGKVQDVIVDFPLDVYGKGPMYNIGPLGLAFLSKDVLVVGGGGNVDDKELLRVYDISGAAKSAIKADKMVASFKLEANEELKAEGNYYGVAASDDAIYVTCNGDDTKGWVARADRSDTKVSNFRRYIATKEATEVDAPVAVAISSRGDVVIGQMGEITIPDDGLLTFYNAKNGKMKRNFEAGLSDITGLVFSPKKKNRIYATDFAWHDTEQGGLFQLVLNTSDEKEPTVDAKKLASLDKPTALAFGADGTLYITVIGTGDKKPGMLLKIAPGL